MVSILVTTSATSMETQMFNACKSAHYERDDEYGHVIMVNDSEWKNFIY